MSAVPPSGTQVEIAAGDYSAVAVTVGGGLRELSYAGCALLDGYPADAIADGGRGQVLAPWPNRLRDGRWSWQDRVLQLSLSDPGNGNAIHGLVRWAPWTVTERDDSRVLLRCHLPAQPGYPFSLDLTAEYVLDAATGLTATLTAINRADQPAPVALGVHPYLKGGMGHADDWVLQVPARTVLVTDDRGIPTSTKPVDGTDYDFREPRAIGNLKLDICYTDLVPDDDGRTRVRVSAPDGPAVELWSTESAAWFQLYTGDTLDPDRRREGLAVEPMTAPANALATREGLIVIGPGESTSLIWGIRAG